MSLGGLAVAIGLIIDDTVVVIENIARHLAAGQSGDAAVTAASREISGAVIGSTLTTMLVFLPLALVQGRGRPVLSVAQRGADHGAVGLDGRQPDDHSRAGGPLSGPAADADDRPDLQSAGRPLRGALAAGLAVSRRRRCWQHCWRSLPGWLLFRHLESGFMPEMDEGALVIDYNMPVGTSLAQTDKVLRRVEAVLLRTRRRGGLHPPHRGRAGPVRDRALHGRHSRQPQAAGPAAPGGRDLRCAPRGDPARGARAGNRADSAGPGPDQRSGRRRCGRSKSRSSAPTRPCSAAWPTRWARSSKKCRARSTSTRTCSLGNPDIVIRPDSVQTARVGLTEMDMETQLNAALYGQVASTLPEQDRLTNIRVRYPDRVRFDRDRSGPIADQPVCRGRRYASGRRGGRGTSAAAGGLRAAGAIGRRSKWCAVPTNCGAKTSSRSSP